MRRRDHEALSPDVLRDLEAMDAALAGAAPPAGSEPVARLATAVRAVRPTPTPAFAAALDRRVAGDGAPVRAPRPARRRWFSPVPLIATGGAVALVAVVALNVAGGVGGGPGSTSSEQGAVVESAGPEAPKMSTVPPERGRPSEILPAPAGIAPDTAAGAGGGADLAAPTTPAAQRRVQRNATLRLETTPGGLDPLVTRVLRTVDAVGGYVASSSVERRTGAGSATFDLRVPVDRLQTAMTRLSRLGAVRARSEDSLDLTRRIATATDRTAGLAAERRSLLKQIAAASSPPQLATLRARLRVVEARLARARAEGAALRRRAAYSTIALDVVTRRAAAGGGSNGADSWTPGDALRDAASVLAVVAGGLLVGLSALLPLALLALAGWGVARAVRHRRRAAALDGPA